MADNYDVVIVGGGHAGAQAALVLTQQGFAGTIVIVGDETELPYERPPLSKEYLAGEKEFERLYIRPASLWQDRGIAFIQGARVTAVDPVEHSVTTAAGRSIGYRHLIWAAGGDPRRLRCDGGDLVGVHGVRNRADVDRMIGELPDVTQAVVIGGGYIGLEAAAVLTKLGKHVVLLEALSRVLARVAGEPLSRFFEDEHRAHGVDLRLDVQVDSLVDENGKVSGVKLADGTVIPAQLVIVGIGIEAAVAPLLDAGAEGGNGVRVDEYCRTSLPDIYAIGDCAEHSNRFAEGRYIRLESVQNANDQATVAAKAICGKLEPYAATPWFWSNQYDLRLQTVGLSTDHDAVVMRGDPATRSFAVIYLRGGHVIALDCVNSVKDYAQGRKLVEQGTKLSPADAADTSRPLKEFLAA